MAQYRLVPEDKYRELVALAERFGNIAQTIAGAPRMELNLPGESVATSPPPPERPGRPAPTHTAWSGKKYRVSRKRGDWSWADVAAQEMSGTFSLDEAVNKLFPMIDTSATRPRDSLRVALDRDDRFKRVDRGDEVCYQRVDPAQLDIDSASSQGGPE